MDIKVRELIESLHASERMVSGGLVADVVRREINFNELVSLLGPSLDYLQLGGQVSTYPSGLVTVLGNWLSLSVSRPIVNDDVAALRSPAEWRPGGNATTTRFCG